MGAALALMSLAVAAILSGAARGVAFVSAIMGNGMEADAVTRADLLALLTRAEVIADTGAHSIDSAVVAVTLRDLANCCRALLNIRRMVDEQACDEGLWFKARTAPEAYLQQELRALHAKAEDTP